MRAYTKFSLANSERMTKVVEHELGEFVRTSPSYIRDTTDFLSSLKGVKTPLPDNVIMFCFDVQKLYPSVQRKEGLAACKEALESRCNPLIPTEDVFEMIEKVLDNNNNNFGLGNKNYIQMDGNTIGLRLGHNFAWAYAQMG